MVKHFKPTKYPVSNPIQAVRNAQRDVRAGRNKDLIEKRLQFVVNSHWNSSKYGSKAKQLQSLAKKSGLDVNKSKKKR